MLVRSKLVASIHADGVNLSGVYEGSQELQAISENAIFGAATPAAWGSLGVEAAAILEADEYYVDLFAGGRGDGNYLLTRELTRTFMAPSGGERIQYRYAAMLGDPVNLEFVIANPAANMALAERAHVCVGMKLARGRQSVAEIVLRQKMLGQFIADGFYKTSHPELYEQQRASLELKLRRAQGLQ